MITRSLFIFCTLLLAAQFDVDAARGQSESVFERAIAEQERAEAEKKILAGDVRGLVWGLGYEDVEGFENDLERLGKHQNKLVYMTKDFGLPASVIYHFYENQLLRADIEYEQKRTIPQDYIDDYIGLQDKISELYGEPNSDEVLWQDDMFKNDPERWGVAVMMGGLRLRTTWSTPRSIITLDFRGKRMQSTMKVTYISKTIIREEDRPQAVPNSRP